MTERKINIPKLFIIASIIFLFLVIVIVIFNLVFYKPPPAPVVAPPKILKNPFPECPKLLYDCNDNQCQYYNFCRDTATRLAGSDSEKCKIYDCGDLLGFAILTKNDKLLAEKYPKPFRESQTSPIVYCQTETKITKNICEKNSRKISLNLTIPAGCSLKGFVFRKDNKWLSANFSKTGDNTYLLNIPFCEAISDINPVLIKEKI